MKTINVRQARQQISALLDSVERGDEIIIQRHGRAVARLVPIEHPIRAFKDRSDFRGRINPSCTPAVDLIRHLRDEKG